MLERAECVPCSRCILLASCSAVFAQGRAEPIRSPIRFSRLVVPCPTMAQVPNALMFIDKYTQVGWFY